MVIVLVAWGHATPLQWGYVEPWNYISSTHFSRHFSPHQWLISYQRSLHIDSDSAFKWFSNYVFVFAIWLRFFSLAAECSHFPQLTWDSPLFLLISRLHVSARKTRHVGSSKMIWTWTRSYWFSQICRGKPWSKGGLLRQTGLCFQHVKGPRPFLDPWIHFDSYRLPPWHKSNNHLLVDWMIMETNTLSSRVLSFYVSSAEGVP